ncbi:MAG: POTRA domain-containing protein, partial [Planctomycetaceae bacterium]
MIFALATLTAGVLRAPSAPGQPPAASLVPPGPFPQPATPPAPLPTTAPGDPAARPIVAPTPGAVALSPPPMSSAAGVVPVAAPASAGAVASGERIVEVRIEGNHATEVSKLPKLSTRAGQDFDPQAIAEDVRALHRSRKFVDVHPKIVRVAEGVVVVFQVVERPMLRYVRYVGNEKVMTRTLRKKAEIDVGDAMDPYVVEEARRRIEAFYHEKGYEAARVSTIEGNKPGDKGAVFLIDEGRSRKTLWTGFVGNTIASDARLLTQIKSKPGVFWLIGGEVDRQKIDEDVDLLTAYYRSLGFFQAKVGRELEVVHGAGRDWTMLTFVINEGPRYSVRNVSFLGNSRFKSEFLGRDLKLKSGEPFNQGKMDADLGLIRDIYGGRGFVFADIRADPRFLEEPGQLDLVYSINEGQRYRVGKINVRIRGEHPHTRHATILNRLSLQPGDILDLRKLREDERRLRASSLFLTDASKGEGPRIAFSKPDPADAEREQMARDPNRPGFRGQSPDGVVAEPSDVVVDLVLEGELAPEATAGAAAPTAPSGPAAPAPAAAPSRSTWRGQSPAPGYAQPAPGYAPPAYRQPSPAAPQAPSYAGQPAPRYAQAPGQSFGVPVVPGPAPPAGAWGGSPIGATGPEAVDYGRTVAPAAVQAAGGPQPAAMIPGVAPVVPAQALQPGFLPPGGAPGVAPFPGAPDFGAAPPLQVFPGNDPYVIVDVDAEETQTGRLMIGAGVNSNAGLVGNIVIDEQNFDLFRLPRSWDDIRNGVAFRGAGQRFRLEAAPGTQLQRYTATFQEPYLFDTRIGLSTSASYFTRYFYDWSEGRVGGRVGLGYQFAFAPNLSVNTGFRGESVDIYNPRLITPAIRNMLGTNSVYGFSGGLIHDTRDSPFMPTQGHLATFEFEQVIGTFVYPR